MAETELDRAERRFAQAKARLQALRNREATKQRKLDTRRKVILGGALVDLAARDDSAAAMLDRLIRNLAREQDRSAFAGWDWRDAGSGGAEDAEAAGVRDGAARAEGASAQPAGGFGGSNTPAASDRKPQAPVGPTPVRPIVDRIRNLQR